jgi:hypothetical protein
MKVGLGIGIGIGIPLLLIAGVLLGMKLVKRRGQDQKPYAAPAYYDAQPEYHDVKAVPQVRQELPAHSLTEERAELYGGDRG